MTDTYSMNFEGDVPKSNIWDDDLRQLQSLADWMDSKFVIPGTKIRFGLDSILGLIPGIGDTAAAAVTSFIIAKAGKYKLPMHVRARMIWNGFLDWFIGLIPFFGDIFDIGFKANRKNIALLIEHLERQNNNIA